MRGLFPEMDRGFRTFPLALAISAMLLRAFLPLGWMPSGSAHAPLIICPMMGGVMPAAPAHPGLPQHHDRFCPFTASLAQLSAPASAPLISLPLEKPVARDISALASVIPARPYSPQFPRGPPPLT